MSERSFNVTELALPANLFPLKAVVNPFHALSDSEGAIETGIMSAHWHQGSNAALYQVLRYSTLSKASRKFKSMKNQFASSEWVTVPSSGLIGTQATETFIACTEIKCRALIQYQEYVVLISTVIDSDMTMSNFEDILIFIDQQFSKRLGLFHRILARFHIFDGSIGDTIGAFLGWNPSSVPAPMQQAQSFTPLSGKHERPITTPEVKRLPCA